MASETQANGDFSVTAYAGDAKTLLAFNLGKAKTKKLAGFTIACAPGNEPPYYLYNNLQFEKPEHHAQDPKEPARSSINAPIHYFRWLHVPGSVHQGLKPFEGLYTYTVTPRYFDAKASLQPLDPALSVAVTIRVAPFVKNGLRLGFARGFTQSQAFVHHFGKNARIRPKGKDLVFDTSQVAGKNAAGVTATFAEEYEWLGFTARARIFEILDEVLADPALALDVFAYDLNEPDFVTKLLAIAKDGRLRVILDDAALHHDDAGSKPEDQFEAEFRKVETGKSGIARAKFGRYAHDKVLLVSDAHGPRTVLTGSTNFSVTGLYVNSNHVLVFDDRAVARSYADVFASCWQQDGDGEIGAKGTKFRQSPLAQKEFRFASAAIPTMEITYSPHDKQFADTLLDAMVARIDQEATKPKSAGNVLFAVMQLDGGKDAVVYDALNKIHDDQSIFSYGISDGAKGIYLYRPGTKQGLLVSGKPASTVLPPPFDQVPGVGLGHQVHHKFVVCGFKSPDAVVYCGSSNLANVGETVNGDNLLAIHDPDVATAFAIEALALVDHFNFLDRYATGGKGSKPATAKPKKPKTATASAAAAAGWFLSTTDNWTRPYYDPKDLKCADRLLFA